MPTPATAEAPVGLRRGAHYFPELESLRGLAILLVYAFHLEGMLWIFVPNPPVPSLPAAYMYGGNTGVGLFFVLSGFLLSQPFLAEADGGPRVSLRRYYTRRALRILPLYYVVVLIGAAATSEHLRDMVRALPYLVFANSVRGWHTPMEPYTNVLWSLCTEVQFYLVLPLLPFALGSPRRRRIGIVALGLYVAAYVCFLFVKLPIDWRDVARLGNSLFGRAWLFLGGIGAAWLYRYHGARLRTALAANGVARNGGADLVVLAALAAFGLVLRGMLSYSGMAAEYPPVAAWHVAEAATWTLVLLAVLLAPLRLKALLVNPVLARLGLWSYSIYLLHVPILRLIINPLRAPIEASATSATIAIVLLTTLVLAVSALSYHLIERPFLVQKARLDA